MDLEDIINDVKKDRKKVKNVGLDAELHAKLQKICEKNNVKIRTVVNRIVEEYIKSFENKQK